MAKKSKRLEDKKAIQAGLNFYASRIGIGGKKRLNWAVAKVQQPPDKMTAGDLANLRLELALFCQLEGGRAIGSDWESDLPTDKEAKEMLKHVERIIAQTVGRQQVYIGRFDSEVIAEWDETIGCYTQTEHLNRGWRELTKLAIGRLIMECGHLLKECPAPAPRGLLGEMCNVWFVARRPNQIYCSPACQSRTNTRKLPSRQKPPIKVKNKGRRRTKARNFKKKAF